MMKIAIPLLTLNNLSSNQARGRLTEVNQAMEARRTVYPGILQEKKTCRE